MFDWKNQPFTAAGEVVGCIVVAGVLLFPSATWEVAHALAEWVLSLPGKLLG